MKQGNFENEVIRVGTTTLQVSEPAPSERRLCEEAHRVEQRNTAAGLRQGLSRHRAEVRRLRTVPDHVDYRPVVDKSLNLYEPIGHRPQQGEFPCIRSLVRHIFGEQYELGMDYLQLLYLQPVQKLPILLLVSEERNTGKSIIP